MTTCGSSRWTQRRRLSDPKSPERKRRGIPRDDRPSAARSARAGGRDAGRRHCFARMAVSRWPSGLSCVPACQIDTFSACQVCTGPTVIARWGTIVMLPPPLVRAFCASVTGCRSTTRVESARYSAGDGGASWCFPSRRSGSLKAQCLMSPCPPCITAQRAVFQLATYGPTSALGKWRFASGMRNSGRIRSKHSSRSARSNESGCVTGTSRPSSNHSSMPQKWACRRSSPSSFTSRATSGNCSVGPIGPQMPTGASAVACFQAVMYSRASAR